jgi:RNA polymerase sigma-70 factor (ECF subfamily)
VADDTLDAAYDRELPAGRPPGAGPGSGRDGDRGASARAVGEAHGDAHGDARANARADEALMERIRARDEAALAALYDRYGSLVFTVALRVVGDRELAEEVMQDAFLRCWNGAESYDRTRGPVSGWLPRIARNRAVDLLRSRQHQARLREAAPLPDPDGPGAAGVGDASEAVITRQAVLAALATLPRAQRQAVELAYYGGLTQVEIARQTGEPLGTIKSRTRTAMDHLRGLLRPHFRPAGPAHPTSGAADEAGREP